MDRGCYRVGVGCNLVNVEWIVGAIGLALGGSCMLFGGRWVDCGCCRVGIW